MQTANWGGITDPSGNQLPTVDPPQTNAHLCKTQHSNLGAHKTPEALPQTLLWAELCPLKIYRLKSRPTVPQNVTVFGDRVFKEVIKLK